MLTLIEGGKNRPYEVVEINGDEEHPDPDHFTELVIVHRKSTPTMTGSGVVPTQAIVTPPFAIGDRNIAEAFCKSLNDFHQHWEDFDWDAHDMDKPAPIFRFDVPKSEPCDTHKVHGIQIDPCCPNCPDPSNDELLKALEPFARYYDLNDCHERSPDDALEVPISDLARARRIVAQHGGAA